MVSARNIRKIPCTDGSTLFKFPNGRARKMRFCPGCRDHKDFYQFYVDQRGQPLRYCSQCRRYHRTVSWVKWHKHELYSRKLHVFCHNLHRQLKGRPAAKKLGINIAPDDIMDLYFAQNGLCAISGVPMTCMPRTIGRQSWPNLSVDRIDSSRGYLDDNVHLVTYAINTMKNSMTVDELRFWCAHVVLTMSDDDEVDDEAA